MPSVDDVTESKSCKCPTPAPIRPQPEYDYEDIMPVVQEQDAEVAAERNIEGKILEKKEKRKRKRKKNKNYRYKFKYSHNFKSFNFIGHGTNWLLQID